jgi:hypothetical protein
MQFFLEMGKKIIDYPTKIPRAATVQSFYYPSTFLTDTLFGLLLKLSRQPNNPRLILQK